MERQPQPMAPSAPPVSCVMPTKDRRRYVPLAIGYFLEQDYANRELVVVDDGTDPINDLIPDDPRIRYFRLDEPVSTGAKRNIACGHAEGEIIVHWDDDDWFAPWRVSYQVQQLIGSGADLCGLDTLRFFDVAAQRAWRYRYPPKKRAWVAGGTMAYRRALWQQRRFPEVRAGEDTQFLWHKPHLAVAPLARDDFYVATIHRRNTSRKQLAGRRWSEIPIAEIERVTGRPTADYLQPIPIRVAPND